MQKTMIPKDLIIKCNSCNNEILIQVAKEEISPEYRGEVDNMFAGTVYDSTLDPKKDTKHWEEWYLEKLRKNYPARKDIDPILEEDTGMQTVAGFFDGKMLFAKCNHCNKKIIQFLSLKSSEAVYNIERHSQQWDPSNLDYDKVDNQQNFGTTPVNPNDPLYQERIMGQDNDRVISNIDVEKEQKKKPRKKTFRNYI